MINKQAPEALHHTKYLTVVYRDIKPGDEARELIMHPKMTASSWSHVMNERDRLAALVEAQHARIAELEAVGAGGVQALSAAPAPLSEMPYEKRKAIQEGEQIGANGFGCEGRCIINRSSLKRQSSEVRDNYSDVVTGCGCTRNGHHTLS